MPAPELKAVILTVACCWDGILWVLCESLVHTAIHWLFGCSDRAPTSSESVEASSELGEASSESSEASSNTTKVYEVYTGPQLASPQPARPPPRPRPPPIPAIELSINLLPSLH